MEEGTPNNKVFKSPPNYATLVGGTEWLTYVQYLRYSLLIWLPLIAVGTLLDAKESVLKVNSRLPNRTS
jgi:hypothetical protein